MGFTDERQMAERALEAADLDEAAEAAFPPVARRILQARETLGMTQDDVAARWGEQVSMYWDLEFRDDEAFNVISVQQLSSLAAVLRTSPMVLLFGDEPSPPLAPTPYSKVVARLRLKMAEEGIPIDQMGEKIGWELEPMLANPRKLGELPIFALRWVCLAIGIDWVSTLTNATMDHADDDSIPKSR